MSGKIATVKSAIEYLQKCKPLVGDDLIEKHCEVYDDLTLLLKELVCEDEATWITNIPARAPITEEDLSHPLVGPAEREELTEKLYRVLHMLHPRFLSDGGGYPEIYQRETAEFPDLVSYIEDDESELLVWDVEKKEVVCLAADFFDVMNATEFSWKGAER